MADPNSESEKLRRRMMAMAQRDEEEEMQRELDGRDPNEIDVDAPVYKDGAFSRQRVFKGEFPGTIKIPATSYGAIIGVKGVRIQQLQALPSVSSMTFSKESGLLEYNCTTETGRAFVKGVVEGCIDRSWEPVDEEDEESDEKGDDECILHRYRFTVPRKNIGELMSKITQLSNQRGIVAILVQPRNLQSKVEVEVVIKGWIVESAAETKKKIVKLCEDGSDMRSDLINI